MDLGSIGRRQDFGDKISRSIFYCLLDTKLSYWVSDPYLSVILVKRAILILDVIFCLPVSSRISKSLSKRIPVYFQFGNLWIQKRERNNISVLGNNTVTIAFNGHNKHNIFFSVDYGMLNKCKHISKSILRWLSSFSPGTLFCSSLNTRSTQFTTKFALIKMQ